MISGGWERGGFGITVYLQFEFFWTSFGLFFVHGRCIEQYSKDQDKERS